VVRGSLMLFVYSLGLGVPMLAVAYGSKRYAARLELVRRNSPTIRKFAGWVIILTGIGILLGVDRYLQSKLLPYFPALL
ncbi:MAG: cytochrome C biogenesis protein, partial [Euryarchaeota archaeon]|nr:cytochrome C biogenesis protein [Euryarchaeota archaeon]